MWFLRHSMSVLFLFVFAMFSFAQTEDEIKENAEKLFEEEQYVEATSLYLRLLSLHPRDADYNFRYGTCLLFNSNKKQEAIRYLNLAVSTEGIDPRAFYFHGRALHLNYQFEDAKKSYQKYLQKREKKDQRYDAERELQMCDNGKKLLSTFTDIIVSEKKEIEYDKFFRLYNLESIGGTILVSADFQSKYDKKMGHVPIVHFPQNAKAIYYSSYGDNGENGLDIYVRRRLPDGSWGMPQLLPGAVNTPEDEDFPYMHPGGDYLYFSSKGHNSMGGFDVFYSVYNPDNNSFGRPENVDFAISSPDDDLFYIVDSLNKSAYFASARQSQDGKLHVYRVRVARVPIQEVIIMGDYLSEINPDNKEMTVTVTSNSNGQEVGKIRTNAQGKYSFVFPKGGKYNYEVQVGGKEDVYKFLVEVPFLDEFRPLKQKAVHTTVNGQETVKIVNLFDERVDGAEALIAEVIRKKAELDVNVGNFDLKELDAQEDRNKVLAEMGFRDMTMGEVSDQLEELTLSEKLKIEKAQRIEANMNSEIVSKSKELAGIDAQIEELRKAADSESDPARKHQLLQQIQSLEVEKAHVADVITGLNDLRDQAMNTIQRPSESGIGKIEMIESQFNSLMASEKEEEALKLLARNKDIINKSRNESPDAIVNAMVKKSLSLTEEIDGLNQKQREMESEKRRLEQEIRVLDNQLINAKKKDAERIRGEIKSKEEELALVEEVLASTSKSIAAKAEELSVVDSNIASLQKAMLEEAGTEPTMAEVKKAVEEAKQAESEVSSSTVEKEIAQLESSNPELNPDYVAGSEDYNLISAQHESREAEILQDPSLSNEEKNQQVMAHNDQVIGDIEERLNAIESAAGQNGRTPEQQEEERKLKELKATLEQDNKERGQSTSVADVHVAEELQKEYGAGIQEISKNDALTPEEKLERQIALANTTIGDIDTRINTIDEQLQQGGDPQLEAELQQLESVRQAFVADKKQRESELETLRTTQPADVALSVEDVVEELVPGYQSALTSIENDPQLSQEEKLTRLQEQDKTLVQSIRSDLNVLNGALQTDPEDAEAIARKEMLESILAEKEERITERENTLASLQSTPPSVNDAEVRDNLVTEVGQVDPEARQAIENSAASPFEKERDLLDLENNYLTQLQRKQEEINREAERSPEDAELQARARVIAEMIREQEMVVDQQKLKALREVTPEQVSEVVSGVDRTYSVDIGELERSSAPTRNDDIANREDVLQERLSEAIREKERELDRRYSVTAELELGVLHQAMSESEAREEQARNATAVVETVETQDTYIGTLREEILGPGESPLEQSPTTKGELTVQDQLLAYYETQLTENIEKVREQTSEHPEDIKAAQQLKWLEEELEKVQEKRRRISVTLGELESSAIASTANRTPQNDPELATLNTRESELRASLNQENLSREDRREIEEELRGVREDRTERENELYSEQADRVQEENTALTNQLASLSNEGDPQVSRTVDQYEQEAASIEEELTQAEKARSPEERNYLLKEAASRQEELNNDIRNSIADEKRKEVESESEVSLLTREELEQRRRTFTVRIGELNTEIMRVEKEIEHARKKEIPALETQKATLLSQRTTLELQLQEVETRLLQLPTREPVVNDVALEKELSFNEERSVAASEEYERYYTLANEALEVEQQIANLETEIQQEREHVNQLLSNPVTDPENEEVRLGVERIKALQADIDRLSIELVQRKYAADQALPSDGEEAMRIQNLAIRGVRPIKTLAVATALIQLPADGLAIDAEGTSPYSAENPIPVGVTSPSGLVYRVQIGAFAKPIPQDLFKEFNPVSGEKINGTNITRYMAGYFNNSDAVVNAREQIRALGYADAFVVAYCDGERIQFGDARRREQEGTCVPKGTNELMVEVATRTAETLGLPLTNEVQEVPEHTYNQAPGAAEADPIEIKQGLFFTVQIGVFNRPVGPEYTYGLPDLMTIRLPNGQIRYASGMFDSVEDALPRRQEALDAGVKGAFVTAYYKGERITLAEARRLLSENGSSILQSEIEKAEAAAAANVVEAVETNAVQPVRTDTVSTESVVPVEVKHVDEYIQIVTRKQFEEFPRDVLNRYNAEGNFFYDAKDKRVKSVIYTDRDDLPRLWNFREDIDTVYLSPGEIGPDSSAILEIRLATSPVPGDFIDWLMRFNYRKEFSKDGEGMLLRIYGVEPNKVSEVQGNVRKFGLEAKAIEEEEFEIEMEEK